jgi:hypothetical protein
MLQRRKRRRKRARIAPKARARSSLMLRYEMFELGALRFMRILFSTGFERRTGKRVNVVIMNDLQSQPFVSLQPSSRVVRNPQP